MNRRILVVDDNEAIHQDIRTVLVPQPGNDELDALMAEFQGASRREQLQSTIDYHIDFAYQGQEGLAFVRKAVECDDPYALAIVDMRMPPGWDGIETIKRIREVDSHIQIAICTAYSDYSWNDIHERFGQNDWLLIFKKPFDLVEVRQLACALTEKWNLGKQAAYRMDELESMVEQHARQLQEANFELGKQNELLHSSNERLSQEISARQVADERIRQIAYHDALTDLPNRTVLMEQLDLCIEKRKQGKDYLFAVLFLDLDDFKIVNDSLGHRVGDEVLCQIAQALRAAVYCNEQALRTSHDTVARLGGDEFIILLDNIKDPPEAIRVAERIQKAITKPLNIEQKDIIPSVSIGIAVNHGDYDESADIVRDADTALYHVKVHGKGQVALFDQAMRTHVLERMDLENDLRQALEKQELFVYYQPIVSLETGEIESFEALTRWQHPTRGLVSPADFIPIAEETGLIAPLGEWVLQEVCSKLHRWRSVFPQAKNLSVNINLSVRQLMRKELLDEIDQALAIYHLDPSAIRLEITESAMMDNSTMVQHVIQELKSRQLEIYVDDFGTGYSSLSMLHKLPVSAIKLDQSFVKYIAEEQEFSVTVQAVVMLARNNDIKLIAEGIETKQQLTQLQELECGLGQGFYFSRAVSFVEVEAMLASDKRYRVIDSMRRRGFDGQSNCLFSGEGTHPRDSKYRRLVSAVSVGTTTG